jgi:RNA polymerase sigma-70 factor (ECF subfamily)
MAVASTGAMSMNADPTRVVVSPPKAGEGGASSPCAELSTDEQLMLAHQRGEADAFAELFARYRQAVYGFFRRRLEHAARAEELAQEVFVALLHGTERWEPRASVRTWVFSIAMKMVWAERRRAAREAGAVAIEAVDAALVSSASAGGSAKADAALAVRQAVERLEEGEREVLLLREYEQLRYDEIAALLGVPVGTVRSRLFRARMALKDLLSEKGGTADERR